jgi:hypothetical protein
LETVRNNHTTHHSTPVFLFRAVLTLWLHSFLLEKQKWNQGSNDSDTSASIVISSANTGANQIKIGYPTGMAE